MWIIRKHTLQSGLKLMTTRMRDEVLANWTTEADQVFSQSHVYSCTYRTRLVVLRTRAIISSWYRNIRGMWASPNSRHKGALALFKIPQGQNRYPRHTLVWQITYIVNVADWVFPLEIPPGPTCLSVTKYTKRSHLILNFRILLSGRVGS